IVVRTSLFTDLVPLFLRHPGVSTLFPYTTLFRSGNGTYDFNIVPVSDGLQSLTLGNVVSGAIATPGQQQQYTFTLPAAARLYFDSLTNTGQLHWSLNGPTGNVVNNRGFSGSDAQSIGGNPVLSLLAGNYTLSVSGNGDNTGAYEFRLFDLATANSIVPGTPVSDTLNPANATKAYQFTAAAGDLYLFPYLGSSGQPNAYWRLIDPYNKIVFGQSFNNSVGTNSLSAAGTYTVLIEGYIGDNGVGTYGFNVQPAGNVPPTTFTGTPLTLGSAVTGSLAASTDTDAYTFTLGATANLYFDARTNAGFQWSLRGPPGLVVNSRSFLNSDGVDITDPLLALPAGSYQLSVTGTAGSYQFRLLNFTNAAVFTPGTVVSSTLSPANSTVFYQFNGNAGDRYYFDGQL